jgi:acyl transferase domain-containing protein
MGAGLYAAYPVFASALDACCEALEPHVTLPSGYASLRELMFDDNAGEALAHTPLTQPALFALEVALARLWGSLGVVPSVVAGHSIGAWWRRTSRVCSTCRTRRDWWRRGAR